MNNRIVAWLRDPKAQMYVVSLTMAYRNADVSAAMRKCADIIEAGDLDTSVLSPLGVPK